MLTEAYCFRLNFNISKLVYCIHRTTLFDVWITFKRRPFTVRKKSQKDKSYVTFELRSLAYKREFLAPKLYGCQELVLYTKGSVPAPQQQLTMQRNNRPCMGSIH